MLNQVQHDEVVVASPWTPPIRHPEFISGSRLWDAESSSAWRGSGSVTLNSFQGLVFEMLNQVQHDEVVVASPWTRFRVSFLRCWIEFSMTGCSVTLNTTLTSPWIYFRVSSLRCWIEFSMTGWEWCEPRFFGAEAVSLFSILPWFP